ncbi:MAG: 30S ribosomal protein S4 [Patescibacteria group bacterium]
MITAKCRICRREGRKLFLKGERCYSQKCSLIKRKYPPGLHGPKGYPQLSEYGIQLREKQRLKRTFGIREKQLKLYYRKAIKTAGNPEENLLKLLEQRLDNVVYKAGFASSRSAARQLINHGHIRVNGRRVDIPSYQVKPKDEITLKPTSKMIEKVKDELMAVKASGRIRLPDWISLDEEKLTIKILRRPESVDLPQEFNIKSIIEFYSR